MWRKKEGVWGKCAFFGEKVKNAGRKKIFVIYRYVGKAWIKVITWILKLWNEQVFPHCQSQSVQELLPHWLLHVRFRPHPQCLDWSFAPICSPCWCTLVGESSVKAPTSGYVYKSLDSTVCAHHKIRFVNIQGSWRNRSSFPYIVSNTKFPFIDSKPRAIGAKRASRYQDIHKCRCALPAAEEAQIRIRPLRPAWRSDFGPARLSEVFRPSGNNMNPRVEKFTRCWRHCWDIRAARKSNT